MNINNKRNRDTTKGSTTKKAKIQNTWESLKFTQTEINNLEHNIVQYNKNEIDKWVSATSIKNYLINDPLIDWLKLYYKSKKYNLSSELSIKRNELSSLDNQDNYNILFDFGNKFEQKVYDELKILSIQKRHSFRNN